MNHGMKCGSLHFGIVRWKVCQNWGTKIDTQFLISRIWTSPFWGCRWFWPIPRWKRGPKHSDVILEMNAGEIELNWMIVYTVISRAIGVNSLSYQLKTGVWTAALQDSWVELKVWRVFSGLGKGPNYPVKNLLVIDTPEKSRCLTMCIQIQMFNIFQHVLFVLMGSSNQVRC